MIYYTYIIHILLAVICDGSGYQRPSKNVCREEQQESCKMDTCFSRVTCVDLPEERSVCLECPEGMLGDGKNCTSKYPIDWSESDTWHWEAVKHCFPTTRKIVSHFAKP